MARNSIKTANVLQTPTDSIRKPLLIAIVITFLGIGIYLILRPKAAVCENCTPTSGLKIFDAVGTRTVGSDWEGDPELLPGLPSNLTSPVNYAEGNAYARFEVLQKPSTLRTGFIFCMNDQYFNERCSYMNGTHYDFVFTEPGVIYANLGKPKLWQQVSNGVFNFEAPLHAPYIQFVDLEYLDTVIAGGANPNDLNFDQEAKAVLNWLYYDTSKLGQHLPIKVDAELYFTEPNTYFVPPASWDCPVAVCPTPSVTNTPTPTTDPTVTPTPTPTPSTDPTPTIDPTPTPTTTPTPNSNADITGDGIVGVLDLAKLISNYNKTNATKDMGDLNNDGSVTLSDLSMLVKAWGT